MDTQHNGNRGHELIRAISLVILMVWSVSNRAAELSVRIEDSKQVAVHDTVVELIGQAGNSIATQEAEIVQMDKAFSPELSVVSRGSSVLFTNKDPFQHHVYSVSQGNQFDLPLYHETPPHLIEFDSPGVVKLGCNIHDWMLAFIYVSVSPYLVITDASGRAEFSDLPAGEYQLRIWNPRLRNNKKIISQALIVEENDQIDQIVTVSLRKKIRKPRRPQNNQGYDY